MRRSPLIRFELRNLDRPAKPCWLTSRKNPDLPTIGDVCLWLGSFGRNQHRSAENAGCLAEMACGAIVAQRESFWYAPF